MLGVSLSKREDIKRRFFFKKMSKNLTSNYKLETKIKLYCITIIIYMPKSAKMLKDLLLCSSLKNKIVWVYELFKKLFYDSVVPHEKLDQYILENKDVTFTRSVILVSKSIRKIQKIKIL